MYGIPTFAPRGSVQGGKGIARKQIRSGRYKIVNWDELVGFSSSYRFKNLILRKFATLSFLFISVKTQIKGQISIEKTTIIASTFYVHFTKVNEDINFVKPSFVK